MVGHSDRSTAAHPTGTTSRVETGRATPPAEASAEWIVEQDGSSLTDFGSVTFSMATDARHGAGRSTSSFAPATLAMTDTEGSVMATVPALGLAGNRFTTTWAPNADRTGEEFSIA